MWEGAKSTGWRVMDGDKGKLKEKMVRGVKRDGFTTSATSIWRSCLREMRERERVAERLCVNDFHELDTFSNRVLDLPAYLTLFPPLCDLVTCEELMAVPPEAVGAVQCVCVHCGGYWTCDGRESENDMNVTLVQLVNLPENRHRSFILHTYTCIDTYLRVYVLRLYMCTYVYFIVVYIAICTIQRQCLPRGVTKT